MTRPMTIDDLLKEQRTLTAVEEFSQRHDEMDSSVPRELYRDLIPAGKPGEGQQYAFEVDLDSCSGCKACVAACHNLNGLEEDEMWRSVGQLIGGSSALQVVQHVTTACHHCLEPACLSGCPVNAYEKDLETGIVRHLDDQCIGCQYCILKCPYEVPVYSQSKGIVRKCDMCHQRLAVGEAPACVQSCPNGAIRIALADCETVREESEVHPFLPGAPDPAITLPTTSYKSEKALPRNTLPADYYRVPRAHSHMPLVGMLVLTQMSAGAFCVEQVLNSYWLSDASLLASGATIPASMRVIHLVAALLLGGLGLFAGIFHLGRPLYAFRAILGIRTSWLSRELLGFGVFAKIAAVYVVVSAIETLDLSDSIGFSIPSGLASTLGIVASLAGLVAVMTSVMIYVDTRRPMWTLGPTTTRFMLTVAILGIPVSLLVSLVAGMYNEEFGVASVMELYGKDLCRLLMIVTGIKFWTELTFLLHLRDPQMTPRRRSAMLLADELSMVVIRRFFFGFLGGIALPATLVIESLISADNFHPVFVVAICALMTLLLFISEIHERYLFFAASVTPRMPGNQS